MWLVDAYNAVRFNHGVRREHREAYSAVVGFSRKDAKKDYSDGFGRLRLTLFLNRR